MAATITREEAANVLFYFTGESWEPGSFTMALLHAFSKADSSNFQKLSSAFPGYGAAMHLAMHSREGISILRDIFDK